MPATRTQVYFTEEQRRRLDALAKREGKTLAAVVRDAVDAHTARTAAPDLQTALDAAFGAMPELEVPARSEWDRGYG
jgi:predicted DNA-binding protein